MTHRYENLKSHIEWKSAAGQSNKHEATMIYAYSHVQRKLISDKRHKGSFCLLATLIEILAACEIRNKINEKKKR
jgi:hypothetical protein